MVIREATSALVIVWGEGSVLGERGTVAGIFGLVGPVIRIKMGERYASRSYRVELVLIFIVYFGEVSRRILMFYFLNTLWIVCKLRYDLELRLGSESLALQGELAVIRGGGVRLHFAGSSNTGAKASVFGELISILNPFMGYLARQCTN